MVNNVLPIIAIVVSLIAFALGCFNLYRLWKKRYTIVNFRVIHKIKEYPRISKYDEQELLKLSELYKRSYQYNREERLYNLLNKNTEEIELAIHLIAPFSKVPLADILEDRNLKNDLVNMLTDPATFHKRDI